jgi:hypothetical protein
LDGANEKTFTVTAPTIAGQEMLGQPTEFALFREANGLWEAAVRRLPKQLQDAVVSVKETQIESEFAEKYEAAVS